MNINSDTTIYIYICLHFIHVYIHIFIIMNHESIYQTSFLFSCFVVVHSISSDPSQLVINERYAQVEPIDFVPAIRIVNFEQEEKK